MAQLRSYRAFIWVVLVGCATHPTPKSTPTPAPAGASSPSLSPPPAPPASPPPPAPPPPSPPPIAVDWDACRLKLNAARDQFLVEAPKVYRPYADLWRGVRQNLDPVRELDGLVKIELNPGRTWRFVAGIAVNEEVGELLYGTPPPKPDAWTAVPDTDFTFVRNAGQVWLVVHVETERSEFPLATHPLVLAFDRHVRPALDQCAGR